MMNPYPGLRPFDEPEHDVFFGREEEIDELVKRLAGGASHPCWVFPVAERVRWCARD